ncbi:MAG TPA: polysaccharide pyruvyl transferase family protein [Candidatus Saccharimonadales bacterium]
MTIGEAFAQKDLDKSVLIGYYGGGNYGDELLMEVLSNMFAKHNLKDISISYQTPDTFTKFHHNFGYSLIPLADKIGLVKTILKKKNIIIGGGGLWGMDVNFNIFLLSVLLFISRWVFGKKVYLFGVGYYNSTTKLGHISAFLASKAANVIVSRDEEARGNFTKFNKNTHLDTDIAWYLRDLDLSAYQKDVDQLEKNLDIKPHTLFVTLRRFEKNNKNNYQSVIQQLVATETKRPVIVAIMEPASVDPQGYKMLQQWQQQYPNIQIIDFSFNPLALYLLFRQHSQDLTVISPQFHVIITAYLNGITFFPLAYDNKVRELIKVIAPKSQIVDIKAIDIEKVAAFVK